MRNITPINFSTPISTPVNNTTPPKLFRNVGSDNINQAPEMPNHLLLASDRNVGSDNINQAPEMPNHLLLASEMTDDTSKLHPRKNSDTPVTGFSYTAVPFKGEESQNQNTPKSESTSGDPTSPIPNNLLISLLDNSESQFRLAPRNTIA